MSVNSVVRRGLSIGIGLAVFAGLITALYDAGALPGIVQVVEFLAAIGGFFVAGLLASRDTRRVGAGVVAALITSVLFGVVFVGSNVVLALVSPATFARDFGYHNVSSSALVGISIGQSLVGLILWVALGAGVGALGGVIGRRRAVPQAPEIAVR